MRLAALRTPLCDLIALVDELLFPARVKCLCCRTALGEDEEDGLCPACAFALEELGARQEAAVVEAPPPGVDYVSAAYPYEAQARRLILRLKFRHVRAAAIPLARAMAALPGGEEEIIVPMPTTRARLRARGYNQAQLLGERLGERLGMPCVCALTREDNRPAQSTLSAAQRRENLVGCMRAGGDVKGKRVLLVDDVYTTGSSAAEAARALLSAGATGVGVFVAARSAGESVL